MVLDNKGQALWNGKPLAVGRCSCGMALTSSEWDLVQAWLLQDHSRPDIEHIGTFELIGP